jgi:ElaB/YqjD/DUF883 family membrane-anchored ribosome-binding protein
MTKANKLKEDIETLSEDVREYTSELRDQAEDALETAEAGIQAAEAEIRDEVRGFPWKRALTVAVGLAVVAGVVMIARRRGRAVSLLEKGLRDGTKLAVLIPGGLHRAQSSAAHLWGRRPKVHVEWK